MLPLLATAAFHLPKLIGPCPDVQIDVTERVSGNHAPMCVGVEEPTIVVGPSQERWALSARRNAHDQIELSYELVDLGSAKARGKSKHLHTVLERYTAPHTVQLMPGGQVLSLGGEVPRVTPAGDVEFVPYGLDFRVMTR